MFKHQRPILACWVYLICSICYDFSSKQVECAYRFRHLPIGKTGAESHHQSEGHSSPLPISQPSRRRQQTTSRTPLGFQSKVMSSDHEASQGPSATLIKGDNHQPNGDRNCCPPSTTERRAKKSSRRADGNQNGDCASDETTRQQAGKTIETAVFIDQALDNKFNGLSNGLVELNKLVMTIMSQVQYLFRYSSLQVPITIKIVLVEHLKDSERQGLGSPDSQKGDIDAYLSNFCNWQQSRLENNRRLWWDHAILLSGLDLYKETPSRNHSGVLGLAWVGGMCKGNYSCTVNEASNFEAAFVIAHEIGHSLGIMHDGQRNRCDPNGFIMSERTGAGKVHWSRCSNNYLNESIKTGQLKCLELEQSGQPDSLFDLDKLYQPGRVYAINEQCKMAFGSGHSALVSQQQPFNAVCRELWCVAGTNARAAHPALEGSSCGQNRTCREGKCAKPL